MKPALLLAVFLLALAKGDDRIARGSPVQESPEAREARRDRINELAKLLRARDETARLQAIDELGGIRDREARSLLSRKLRTDSQRVRIAAARALVRQSHPSAASAVAKAILHDRQNESLVKGFITVLGELDLCASITPILVCLELNHYAYADDALRAIEMIGCTKSALGLIKVLKKAELQERRPDYIFIRDPLRPLFLKRRKNPKKDFELARTAPLIRRTLTMLAGGPPPANVSWVRHVTGGGLARRQGSKYYCGAAHETFELPTGKPVNCPLAAKGVRHRDTFLKHIPK